MFRSPNEMFSVNLGPTFDGLTMSKEDFEVEEAAHENAQRLTTFLSR
jgi:hypothetical protein